jgi:hypothetical protein
MIRVVHQQPHDLRLDDLPPRLLDWLKLNAIEAKLIGETHLEFGSEDQAIMFRLRWCDE